MKLLSVFLPWWVTVPATMTAAATVEETSRLVNDGHWQKAQQQIEQGLAQPGLSFHSRAAWQFQSERMARMRLDFDKTRGQILQETRTIVPTLSEEMFARWEKAGAIEFLDVDGERWFFQRAARNLFLVYPEAKAIVARGRATAAAPPPYRLEDIRRILAHYDRTGERFNSPMNWRVAYTLTVKPGAVPAGETIRAWLPFPHAGDRQTGIRLVSSDPPLFIPGDPAGALACVYLEKKALDRQPTRFKISFEYTTTGFYQTVDPDKVQPVPGDDRALAPYLAEQPPHLVFSAELKKLSRDIVRQETNPYLKARRLFQWIGEHIPWAGAREYSTLDCLPQYALTHRQGDCGIQTMLFMILCRLNGIPARWESGWTTGPDKNMHDWCEIYLAPYGWMPVDVSYGLVTSEPPREKWFFLGGIDCHRLAVNTDHSQPLYPAKTFFRSEFIDFQRGEVEWRGGNLYFNQWDWDFNVEEISPKPEPAATRPAISK